LYILFFIIMPNMTVSQFFELPQTNRTQRKGLGNGLYGLIIPLNKKSNSSKYSGKYFYWKNSKSEKRIGSCRKFSERQARKKVLEFQDWVRQGKSIKLFGQPEPRDTKTFKDASDGWFNSTDVQQFLSPITVQNYKAQLYNQAMPHIGEDTLLKDLMWRDDTRGKEIVMNMLDILRKGRTGEQARKVLGVCRQVFNYAIERGWMSQGSNPAVLPDKWRQVKGHNPSISWKEVPKLLQDIQRNEPNGTYEVQMVVKMMLMTALRASAVTQLRWSWIKEVDGIKCFEIPPFVLVNGKRVPVVGVKRKFEDILNGTAKPLFVPITDQMEELLDDIGHKTKHTDFIFLSTRGKKYPHVCPDAPNKYLRALGYKGKLTAHGWRSVFYTAGQDVFKTNLETIKRQMGHVIGDNVRQAYDRSRQLEERKIFMQKWSTWLVENGLVITEAN